MPRQTLLTKPPYKLYVTEVSNKIIDRLLEENHYSKKVTENRWKSFGIFYDGILEGGMQIGYGIRPQVKEHIIEGADSISVKEFDRMWLSDKLPKNSESKVIGVMIRYLKKNHPELKAVISYADGIRGKIGTIYQASNFLYLGAINGEFYYLPSRNEWIHPVSMYHRHKTRAIGTLKKIYPEIQHIRGLQHRYIYFLDTSWKKKLKITPKPYPKKRM